MNAEEKTKLIASAIFRCNFGKQTHAKELALELLARGKTNDAYREHMKEGLFQLTQNNPELLLEIAKALCWLKAARKRDKYPRDHDLIAAYSQYAFQPGTSFPPNLNQVKAVFIKWVGKKKWNGGHDDDPTHGDFSARRRLTTLGLPLKEMKKGRPKGSKSVRTLKEGIAKKK